MIRSTVACLLLVCAAAAATAAAKWNGAGWYQIEDVFDDGWIIAGPFSDKGSCDASLPADDEEAEFYCEYLASQPSWDY
jgi:hypothetical protein